MCKILIPAAPMHEAEYLQTAMQKRAQENLVNGMISANITNFVKFDII